MVVENNRIFLLFYNFLTTVFQVEKSLQRINRGSKNAMYTSQKSIENKIGDDVRGWKDLLISVGFRFEPATNGIPPSVFFPQNDPGERLTQCSASLQALLGLTQTSWTALSKLLSSPEAADEIIALFRQVVVLLTSHLESGEHAGSVQVPVNVKLWRVPGCHELLASLGFDLTEVGKEDVTLKMGKSAHRRQIQFALQALLALFDTQDAPRSLEVDEDDGSSDVMDDELEDEEHDVHDGYSDEEKLATPFPAPRRLGLRTADGSGHSSAFTCYVRKRGEPDGRQAGNGDSPTQPGPLLSSSLLSPPLSNLMLSPPTSTMYQSQQQHIKGHESDCNFTPSPVDTLQRSLLFGSPVAGHYHPQNHHHHGAGRRPGFKTTPGVSPLGAGRPDSSSSASSFNEWDSHHQHPTLAMRQTFGVRRPAGHSHFPSVQQKINQALGELSTISSAATFKQPLYENSGPSIEYTSRQPAGRPVVPIRSVFTDVGYQASLKITDRSDPNDKFSVRAEFGKSSLLASQANSTSSMSVGSNASSKSNGSSSRQRRNQDIQLSPAAEARLDPGVVKRVPPTGESGSPEGTLVTKTSESETKSRPGAAAPARNAFADMTFQKPAADNIAGSSTPIKQLVKRETPIISEVYHERNLGLGLAPPLSKLIMANNLQVVQVDHHSDSDSNDKPASISLPSLVPIPGPSIVSLGPSSYLNANLIIENGGDDDDEAAAESFGNFDNLTAIEDAHQRNSLALSAHTVVALASIEKPKLRPPVPPKPSVTETSWYMNTSDSSLSPTAGGAVGHIHPPHHHPHHHPHPSGASNGFNFPQRDEGDGRSMSDSQYSGCSPSGQPNSRLSTSKSVAAQLSYMKLGEYINDQEITVLEEKEVVPKKSGVGHNFSPVVIEGPEYINTGALRLPEASKRKQVKGDASKCDASDASLHLQSSGGDIKHPQLWRRDRHGGLTYTGRFASDC